MPTLMAMHIKSIFESQHCVDARCLTIQRGDTINKTLNEIDGKYFAWHKCTVATFLSFRHSYACFP